MTRIVEIIKIALEANERAHQRDYVANIMSGPNTTFRSELIEMMASDR